MVEFRLAAAFFSSSSSSAWTESPTRRSSPHWNHQQQECQPSEWQDKKVVEQTVRTDNGSFMFRLVQGNLLPANIVSTFAKIELNSNSFCSLAHSSSMCSLLFQISRPDSGNCHVHDGWCTNNTSPYARMRTFFCLRASRRTPHPMHLHWLKVCERSFVCFSKSSHPRPCHFWVFLSSRSLLSLLCLLRHRHH